MAPELPPPDFQDVAAEVLHQRLDLLGRHLRKPSVDLNEHVLHDGKAPFGVVQSVAAPVLAHGHRLLGGVGNLFSKLGHWSCL